MTPNPNHSGEITYVLQQLADLYTPEQAQQWLLTPMRYSATAPPPN